MKQPSPTSPPVPSQADPLGRAFALYGDDLRRLADQGLAADLAGKVGASDVVQDTFFAASRDLDDYRGQTPREFRGWLEGILRNRLLYLRRYFRMSARRTVSREVPIGSADPDASQAWAGELPAQTTASPLSRVVRDERAAAIQEALARLSEDDRLMICWHHQDRLTFAIIGDRLGITEEAARKRWARALVRLRDTLGLGHESR